MHNGVPEWLGGLIPRQFTRYYRWQTRRLERKTMKNTTPIPYRNAYALELALARVVGWAWFLFMAAFAWMWITDTEPRAWSEHMIWLWVLIMIAAGFIGTAEKKAATEHAALEEKMQKIWAEEVASRRQNVI